MQITVNGIEKNVEPNTLDVVLHDLGFNFSEIVVAINLEFVPKTTWNQRQIQENDNIDVLTPMEGG